MTKKSGPVQDRHEYKLFRLAWIKAFKEGELRIDFETPAEVHRMKFSLYNAARAVREGKLIDEEFLKAIMNCSLRSEGKTLIIQSWKANESLQTIAEQLGFDLSEVEGMRTSAKTQEEYEAELSAGRLFARMQEENAGIESRPQVSADRPRLDYRDLKKPSSSGSEG